MHTAVLSAISLTACRAERLASPRRRCVALCSALVAQVERDLDDEHADSTIARAPVEDFCWLTFEPYRIEWHGFRPPPTVGTRSGFGYGGCIRGE